MFMGNAATVRGSSPPWPEDPHDRPLTHRDLDHTPDDGNRYEIIDGELYVSPFPSSSHQHIIARLLVLLDGYVRQRRLGMVFTSGLKVVLDEPTGVGPDVVFISQARLDGLLADGFYGAPDLLVEVLSTKPALDTLIKKQKYARSGVPHYWIVDPEKRTLHAYRLEGDRYHLMAEVAGEAVFEPSLFPDLAIPLADLWLF
jgi:Uma2 family endonuclease